MAPKPPERSWNVKLAGDSFSLLEDLHTSQKQKMDLNYMFSKANVLRKGRRGVLFCIREKKLLVFLKFYIHPYKQLGL